MDSETQNKIVYNVILGEYNHLLEQDYLSEESEEFLDALGVIKRKYEAKLNIPEHNTQPVLIRVEDLKAVK